MLGFALYLLIDKPIRNIQRFILFPSKISDSFLIKKSQGQSILKKNKAKKQGQSLRFDRGQRFKVGSEEEREEDLFNRLTNR